MEELHEFSARSFRADPRRPRCFRDVLLCDPSPARNVTTGQLRPFAAAQWVRRPACVCPSASRSTLGQLASCRCHEQREGDIASAAQVLDFYRTTYRSAFSAAPAELLRIVFAAPNFANLETVVEVRGWLAGTRPQDMVVGFYLALGRISMTADTSDATRPILLHAPCV